MAPGLDLIWPNQKIVDVIFLGNPLNFITQRHLWPLQMKFRLWVLCETNKKILTYIIGLKTEEVSVIPRSLLFPIKKTILFKENFFNEDITLIYSGRLTHEKNFSLVVEVVNMIQNKSKKIIDFSICSPLLSQSRKKEIMSEFNKYQWKYNPKILGDLGTNWHKKIAKNSVLISLSTYRQEDFGVSVAQFQQLGRPIILSDWSGHRDVEGPNVIKISPKLIIQENAKKIAQLCLNKRTPEKSCSQLKFKKPSIINYAEVEKGLKEISSKKIKIIQESFFDDHLPTAKKLPKKMSHILMGKE